MIKKYINIRYVIGFILIAVSYSTVKGSLNNSDVFVERLLEISHAFFIPVIIGFVLVWPLFRYKSTNKDYNITRVFIGGGMLVINLVSFLNLISDVFSYISDYEIGIIDFYFMNADFSASFFLIFVRIGIACLLLKPFLTYSQLKKIVTQAKKNSDSWKKKPDDFDKTLY